MISSHRLCCRFAKAEVIFLSMPMIAFTSPMGSCPRAVPKRKRRRKEEVRACAANLGTRASGAGCISLRRGCASQRRTRICGSRQQQAKRGEAFDSISRRPPGAGRRASSTMTGGRFPPELARPWRGRAWPRQSSPPEATRRGCLDPSAPS
jgi:hypothetical protein